MRRPSDTLAVARESCDRADRHDAAEAHAARTRNESGNVS
jgi:hypothetical protein